ncbi:asparagine synthase-related protein [Vibrio sp. D431a]|uniref:asparagine synthase-related protein n=1 Tax=Vibrio sp. D431a TaxID=2837388 RepID=UPI0025543D7F|nr:asparagine synthase-related protein [Vibrio sp. D431a]MDK9790658.1 hypothetical protein [Vibrio sp. D431a]
MLNVKLAIEHELKIHKNKKIIVPLSSGMDSNSILFSCYELGLNAVAVSFRMDTHESRDFKVAKNNAKALGIPFEEIILDSNVEAIKGDVVKLVRTLKCRKKTEIECTRPMYHLYKLASEIGGDIIISGLGAEYNYLESKKAVMYYKHRPDEYREMMFEKVKRKECMQIIQHEIMCKHFGIEHTMPYLSDTMFREFRGTPWEASMKGVVKRPVKEGYAHILSMEGIRVYSPQGYQVGDSGIAKSFEQLLDSDWNLRECTHITAVYNDIIKGNLDDEMDKYPSNL